ncbi:MAG: transcription-repair coupling factor [Bacteroidales bacterium]|nr:transcription-repair coupling factor [Bacteroidales bacterium]
MLHNQEKNIFAADIVNTNEFLKSNAQHPGFEKLEKLFENGSPHVWLKGMVGSSVAMTLALTFEKTGKQQHLAVLPDKEKAAYFYNDLETLLGDSETDHDKKKVLFYPTTYKRPYESKVLDKAYELSRTEVLKRFVSDDRKTIVVTYPEALSEKVITKKYLSKNTMRLKQGEEVSLDFLTDLLVEYHFEVVDFVAEPGQFAIRGGIVDVFSFSNDHPFRIEFFGDQIESIRTFDPESQRSLKNLNNITLLPNIQDRKIREERVSFMDYLPSKTHWWLEDVDSAHKHIVEEFEKAEQTFKVFPEQELPEPSELFINGDAFLEKLSHFHTLEFGAVCHFSDAEEILFHQAPQPAFNKNFELLRDDLIRKAEKGFTTHIFSSNQTQIDRLNAIFSDMNERAEIKAPEELFQAVHSSISAGFVDNDIKLVCYTDHQLFERYHKFHLREGFGRKESLSLKELYDLKPGDYVTHVDHGVGQFDGLQVIDNNGKKQEAVRLIYKNNDLLYVSIHSLHRISKYVGRDGSVPKLNKLGTGAWNKLKDKTKSKVKDIARDLIKLYAERKAQEGYAFNADSYLQNELEASFLYEDTPDQTKTTIDVKKDMEQPHPMDRLVCGDVGFGKTEIAIRAAFKAVADSKQVAVLVPTTILALQHYKTFSDRLKDFPVNIDYLNRFKSSKDQKEALQKLKEGKTDIIIGTHRLLSKDVQFKDLGLFVVDEEQKFGVAAKEKIRQTRTNVDTLTLTATPIPRTLQFSMMGARDLSIMNTAPPNRFPVQTELRAFHTDTIRDMIQYEVSRGGQVFFVHNRVQNIGQVYDMLQKIVPGVRIGVAHGQMEGPKLEKVMLDFINGMTDVLLSTNIIESGLDISNANTIIINHAQNFGLSDLHQLRGRVGRSNKKAFCYLLTPPLSSLPDDAQKRLKALTEFSDLGSGFHIAMRDLDIRGAGNILGAEQSGFISEIGFDMYHKILDEALEELKETEFKDLFAGQEEEKTTFVKDCQMETDWELLIPDFYISNIAERLTLYKELDAIKDEVELTEFARQLEDRFGEIPTETIDLMDTVRLRWTAGKLGIEKLILKFGKMVAYFAGTADSDFYQTELFGHILEVLKKDTRCCDIKEKNGKLTLVFPKVDNVQQAIGFLKQFITEK